jgi:phosphatidylserine/phosphatidylglycerophosphate/cardiolipin synthase-like enzyme
VSDIEVLATGPEFLGRDIRGIEPVIEEIIQEAKSEIQLVAYVFTSNAFHILQLLEEAAERGVKVTIIINNLESQEKKVIAKMKSLTRKYRHFKVFDFMHIKKKQLHAKVVITDRKKAVVGSANFSWSGMYGNHEIGLLIKGENAWKLAKVIDVLSSRND